MESLGLIVVICGMGGIIAMVLTQIDDTLKEIFRALKEKKGGEK